MKYYYSEWDQTLEFADGFLSIKAVAHRNDMSIKMQLRINGHTL